MHVDLGLTRTMPSGLEAAGLNKINCLNKFSSVENAVGSKLSMFSIMALAVSSLMRFCSMFPYVANSTAIRVSSSDKNLGWKRNKRVGVFSTSSYLECILDVVQFLGNF